MESSKGTLNVLIAGLFTAFMLWLGFYYLGLLAMILFSFGFLGGYILWLTMPTRITFAQIRWPYFITLLFFVVHKWEERAMDFFPALSKITGVPVPDTNSPGVYLLYASAVTWLLIPFLVGKHPLGNYLAYTFFTAMGVTELAHFVLPFFRHEPYNYFPGMWSVIALAPVAWWGLYKMIKTSKYEYGY